MEQVLDQRYAVPTVKKLGELQGMYVKYGQTLAGLTNTFSVAWINEFRKLEDQVPYTFIILPEWQNTLGYLW